LLDEELATFENNDNDVDILIGEGPENQQTCEKWSRPDPPDFNSFTDSLIFQQIDIDHYVGEPLPGMPGPQVIKY